MSYADTWIHAPDVAWTSDESRVVVLDLGREDAVPLALEGSGSAIWLALDGVMDTAAIIDSLSTKFDVPRSEIDFVVVTFLRDLRRRGLISLQGVHGDEASHRGGRGARL
ncbi:PqqD family protein [Agreia sp. PsM10]|uniref:PqqD family protein n=1 Tax=Agreia sp. PsM10 TaxID=3030533 RepID=UPI00263B7062|nr:PqqD family protein [Agreia sp. PsM10]MDN4641966.1 PqqD family protein [Agreia sp. PsM10]